MGTLGHKAGLSTTDLMFLRNRDKLRKYFGVSKEVKNLVFECPQCKEKNSFFGLIVHLNDWHLFKWGKIADNLEKAKVFPASEMWHRKLLTWLGYGKESKE
jgi:transposase